MKSETKLSVFDRFFIPGIVEWIAFVVEKITQLAKAHAHSLGDRQLPLLEGGDNVEDYIGTIRGAFNSLIAEADNKIGASSCMHEGKTEVNEAKAETESIDQKLSVERVNLINAKSTLASMTKPNIDRRSIMIALLAAALISGGEMVFNSLGFSLFSENLLFSMLLAIGFWMALHGSAYAIPWLLNRITSKIGKWVALVGITTFFTGLFYWLGLLRIDYAHEAGAEGLANASPIGFTILNLFLFGASTFIIYFFMPSKEVRQQVREHAKLESKVAAIEAKIKELEDRRITIEKEKNERLAIIVGRMAYSREIEVLIQGKFIEVYEAFKNESLLRLRRLAPCLRETPKPLKGFGGDFDPISNEREETV